jgi:hypothetical protein
VQEFHGLSEREKAAIREEEEFLKNLKMTGRGESQGGKAAAAASQLKRAGSFKDSYLQARKVLGGAAKAMEQSWQAARVARGGRVGGGAAPSGSPPGTSGFHTPRSSLGIDATEKGLESDSFFDPPSSMTELHEWSASTNPLSATSGLLERAVSVSDGSVGRCRLTL